MSLKIILLKIVVNTIHFTFLDAAFKSTGHSIIVSKLRRCTARSRDTTIWYVLRNPTNVKLDTEDDKNCDNNHDVVSL